MDIIITLIFISVVVIAVFYISSYNSYIKKRNRVNESLSGIDVALSKRYIVISNLAEVVKVYVKHEQSIFETIAKLRNQTNSDLSEYNDKLNSSKQQLLALVESYPEIKADQHFLKLQGAMIDTEEHLQAARRLHNHNVQIYNTFIMQVPQNLLSPMKTAEKFDYFAASSNEKALVNVIF